MKYGDVDVSDPRTQIPTGTKPLIDCRMRDPRICIGRDGHYCLTGITRPAPGPVQAREDAGPSGAQVVSPENFYAAPPPPEVPVKRACWSPKIHCSKRHDSYFIVGCMNTRACYALWRAFVGFKTGCRQGAASAASPQRAEKRAATPPPARFQPNPSGREAFGDFASFGKGAMVARPSSIPRRSLGQCEFHPGAALAP